MMPIVVSHVSEAHGYIAQQKCQCGGCYEVEMWTMIPAGEELHEEALACCCNCGQTCKFLFDISRVREAYLSDAPEPIAVAWPRPFEGPYGVRRTDYAKSSRHIGETLEKGEISADEAGRQQQDLINTTFPRIQGRYQVFGYRKGSMGFTYLCVDTQFTPDSPRPYFVVCKCLGTSQDHEVRIDDVTMDAIRHEAKIWLELGEHPNIAQLFEVLYVSPENIVLVLEAVNPGVHGRLTLEDWIASGELIWPLQRRYAAGIVRALLHASRKLPGFVHGDLKPSNLLIDVDSGYRLKVTDFGLSRSLNIEIPSTVSSLGTLMYLAPECWSTRKFTPETDIYAFGLIVHEMITGRHPLYNLGDWSMLEEAHKAGVKLHDFDLPDSQTLLHLLRRCVSVDPFARPSLDELAREFAVSPDKPDRREESGHAAELNNKATGLIALGNFRDAIPLLLQALQLEPKVPAGWANLGVAYSNCRLLAHAHAAFKHCFRQQDVPALIYGAYAAHLMRFRTTEAWLAAVAACDKAIELDPLTLQAWCNKAAALNSLGKHEAASEAAEAALRLDPAQPHALLEGAFASWKLNRWSRAKKLIDKAIRISPRFGPALKLKRLMQQRR